VHTDDFLSHNVTVTSLAPIMKVLGSNSDREQVHSLMVLPSISLAKPAQCLRTYHNHTLPNSCRSISHPRMLESSVHNVSS
jgi:hypothetical protein